ncbi:ferrochelatase [Arenicella xantha]|uniref:Ferrochelatase n=1 Tax=Arenicella xantha TaxID=644221 RepID=A0A395JS78_9GAMM|nr:ferrochelatase [Arenicella xantha]RBP53306.1 ferrochelatase [Arenicella xantha]
MKYLGQESDFANSNAKTGVLLINLGTPERPVCPSLRAYLAEFLMDPRVIELPSLLRAILVRGIIVNVRSHKSAATYREIWTENGSPLMLNTVQLGEATAALLDDNFHVEVAMRYGEPSIEKQLSKLHHAGVRNVIAIPLYPQYSGSTNGSTFDAIGKAFRKQRWVPNLQFVSDYYQYDSYIKAIGDSILAHWQKHGRSQKLIMSFHGVPKKYIERGDPYQAQCEQSANAIADHLRLASDEWMLVFQSRLGAQEWLTPYCDQTMKALPQQGVTSVDVICPGFSADCLETLEEIKGENKEYFLKAGGQKYNYIPCLNDSPAHAALMAEIIRDHTRK